MTQDMTNLRKSFSPTAVELPHVHCKCVEILSDDNRHLKQELARRAVPVAAPEDEWAVFERLLHRFATHDAERVRACLGEHVAAPATKAPDSYPKQPIYERTAVPKSFSARRAAR